MQSAKMVLESICNSQVKPNEPVVAAHTAQAGSHRSQTPIARGLYQVQCSARDCRLTTIKLDIASQLCQFQARLIPPGKCVQNW